MNKNVLGVLAVVVAVFSGWLVMTSATPRTFNCPPVQQELNVKPPKPAEGVSGSQGVATEVEVVNPNIDTIVKVLPAE